MARVAEETKYTDLARLDRRDRGRKRVQQIDKRALIFAEGATARGVWEIVEGTIIVFKKLADGRRQIMEVVRAGGWIGAPNSPFYTCSAETLTRSKLRFYGHGEFASSPLLRSRVSDYLETRIEALQDHALLLGRKSAMERIAWFLLALPALGAPARLTSSLGCEAATGVEVAAFSIALKQRDIGDFLGLKVETVSRNLAELKRRMIIATGKRGQFLLLNKSALRSIALSG